MNKKTMMLVGLTACVTPVVASVNVSSAQQLSGELNKLRQSGWSAAPVAGDPLQAIPSAEVFRVQGGVKTATRLAQDTSQTKIEKKQKPKKKKTETKKEG